MSNTRAPTEKHPAASAVDQRLFTLDPEHYDAFVQTVDSPPLPGPRLLSLLRRIPAWERQAPRRDLKS